MKRWAVFFSVILLVAILSSCLPILAQPTHIPHENPATAKVLPDIALLLHFYDNVFDLTAVRQYQDAQGLLRELECAQIPDELLDVTNDYNRCSNQLLTMLNNLEALLDETSTLFVGGQVESAEQSFSEAGAAIYRTQFLFEDMREASRILFDEVYTFTAETGRPVGLPDALWQEELNRLQLVTNNLEERTKQIGQLVDKLDHLRGSIAEHPQTVIDTSFYYPTLLEVSVPESAHPGLPITISGRIISTGGTTERTVIVFLDNIELAQEVIQGQFSLWINPPQQISTGSHILEVVIIPREHHAGVSKSLPINISGIPIRTEIQTPLLAVIPRAIRIRGQVLDSFTPVEDAEVSLIFRDSTTIVKTASDGSFTATMEAPFELSLIGPQELRITIKPEEPWYALCEIKKDILTINPVNMGVMLVVFISLGLLVRSKVRISFPVPLGKTAIPETRLQEQPLVSASRPEYAFTGIKGRILSAYLDGLEVVEKATGIPMASHTTLREFLHATTWLATDTKPFAELTTIAENALYSNHELGEDAAARAERLATIIKEVPYSGAT